MKKLFSLLLIICLCSTSIFAEEQGDEYDDGYVYEINGPGDQLIKMELGGFFPFNFGKQIIPGGGATFGYYKFLTNKIALGGEISISNNFTIGKKPFIVVPITFGLFFQPTIDKFEFPITVGAGISGLSLYSLSYFPGFSAKASAGCFYRVTESWSFGLECLFECIPELHKNSKYNDILLMGSASLGARFHF